MNTVSIILLILLALCLAGAGIAVLKNRGRHCSGCCGTCTGCHRKKP